MANSLPPPVATLQVNGVPQCVTWSPDGTRLAIGLGNGEVAQITTQGRYVWRREIGNPPTFSIAWSPRGDLVALVSRRHVSILSVDTGNIVLEREATPIRDLSWSPSGQLIVFDTTKAEVLDVNSGQVCLEITGYNSSPERVAWSPDGALIASGFKDAFISDARSGVLVHRFTGLKGLIRGLAWSPDGQSVCLSQEGMGLAIWNLKPLQLRHEIQLPVGRSETTKISWSKEGSLLACALEREIHLFRPDTAQEVACLRGHEGEVFGVAFSPDGGRLASASADGTVRIWDVTGLCASPRAAAIGAAAQTYLARQAATVGRRCVVSARVGWVPTLPGAGSKCLGTITLEDRQSMDNPKCGVALMPDGERLIVGFAGGVVRCVHLRTGKVLWEKRENSEATHAEKASSEVSVSPDGRIVAWVIFSWKRVRFFRAEDGQPLQTVEFEDKPWAGEWSPDSQFLAVSLRNSGKVVLCNASLDRPLSPWGSGAQSSIEIVAGLAWSPDGRYLAVATGGGLRVLSGADGSVVASFGSQSVGITWSPDGQRIATCGEDGFLRLWRAGDWGRLGEWPLSIAEAGERSWYFAASIAWHPDGRYLAVSLHRGGSVIVWDAQEQREHCRFNHRGLDSKMMHSWRVAWSPDGAFLVSGHLGNSAVLWDTRELVSGVRSVLPVSAPSEPLSPKLSTLPATLATMHRLGSNPPLSLLRDLLRLTGGRAMENDLGSLAGLSGIRGLVELRWPEPARLGLVALLLDGVPMEGWEPPPGMMPERLLEQIEAALRGEEMEPVAPPPPVAAIERVAREIDDRLLTLLAMLGPDAVARDPGLPLRLRTHLPKLPPLTSARRRLLGLRLDLASSGQAQGLSAGSERSGVTTRGDLRSLLPSQLGYPPAVLQAQSYRGDLLFRDRIGREPPRLRPVVLVLDVSPPAFGPIEAVTRSAAHIIATSLLTAKMPVVVVMAGGKNPVRLISQREDIVDIWTERSLEPADEAAALKLARAMRDNLRGGPLEPVVVVLSHAYFAADTEDRPEVPALRALLVQYPGQHITPAFAQHCERWETVESTRPSDLEQVLGRLLV